MGRILLIDADPGERLIMRGRMADDGHEAVAVETGAKGLVEARSAKFDLILLAAELGGGVDGTEVCRRLKSMPEVASVPVLVYSHQSSSPERSRRIYEAGCEQFVPKSQLPTLEKVARVLLGTKARHDELTEQNRVLEMENRRLQEDQYLNKDLEATSLKEGQNSLISREMAAGLPDGVLIVDGRALVRKMDRGASDLLGTQVLGKTLGQIAPSSGLEAFVRDARSEPRTGFRFDMNSRRGRAARNLMASVFPIADNGQSEMNELRVVLLLDVGKRRIAEEMLRIHEPGIPKSQLPSLVEAARMMFSPAAFRGKSDAARRLRRRINELARQTAPVLIRGERGVGKRFAARVLHYAGKTSGPFLEISCAGLSEESLEKELFGYVKNSFPGAIVDRPGAFSLAADGALFLPEIQELPLSIQKKVVEVLAAGSVKRMGTTKKEPVHARLIASTTQDLHALVKAGKFSPELLSRLEAVTLEIPSLRDRLDDLDELVGLFVAGLGVSRGVEYVDDQVLVLLGSHHWPGNVAELVQCIESACVKADGASVEVGHLPRELRELGKEESVELTPKGPGGSRDQSRESEHGTLEPQPPPGPVSRSIREWDITDEDPISFEHYEKKAILRALHVCNGDKLAAARLLKVGKSTLYRKLKRYGIH